MSDKILSFTQDSLAEALDGVRCLSDLGPELIAEQVFAGLAQQPAPAWVINEQAEFEIWRSEQVAVLERNGYPDGAKAFYRLGSVQWSGWQARSKIAAAPAAPVAVWRPANAMLDEMRHRIDRAIERLDAFIGDDMDMPPHSLEVLRSILAGDKE